MNSTPTLFPAVSFVLVFVPPYKAMGFSLKVVGQFERGNTGTLVASSLVSPQPLSHPSLCPPLLQLQMDFRGCHVG